jgi:hypothetical protein
MRFWFAAGVALNSLCAGELLRRFGRGEAGLRIATRATGQAALLPYAAYYAMRRRRGAEESCFALLCGYAGAHLPHAALVATLMRRHGHPAAGTPVYPMSVYGGGLGYASLLYLLAAEGAVNAHEKRRQVAESYIFIVVHGLPIPHAIATKQRSLALYAPIAALWLGAAALRTFSRS